MELVFQNSLSRFFDILRNVTHSLAPFANSVIEFATTPVYTLISEFTYNELPLGEFFGAPLRLIASWLFPYDSVTGVGVTVIGFVFGVGIAYYLIWNIATWIANIIN